MRNLCTALCLLLLGLTAGCVRASFSALPGQDAGPSDATSVGGDDTVAATLCPLTPLTDCTPQIASGAPCDPVCQGGTCPCGQKCTVAGVGNTATTTCASGGTRASGSSCTIYDSGKPTQYDDCTPGNICLNPDTGTGYRFCFRLCSPSSGCPGGVACAARQIPPFAMASAPLVWVCDPAYLSCAPNSPNPCCNPVTLAGCLSGEHCYLVSPDPGAQDSRTVCDYTAGLGKRLAPCQLSRDCSPGWACDGGYCRQVCDPSVPSTCPAGGACGYTSSSGNQFGYCPP
jgi:hypothetical protein